MSDSTAEQLKRLADTTNRYIDDLTAQRDAAVAQLERYDGQAYEDLIAARDAAVARAEAAADWLKRLEVWLTEQANNEDMPDAYTDAMFDARRQVQSILRALEGAA